MLLWPEKKLLIAVQYLEVQKSTAGLKAIVDLRNPTIIILCLLLVIFLYKCF